MCDQTIIKWIIIWIITEKINPPNPKTIGNNLHKQFLDEYYSDINLDELTIKNIIDWTCEKLKINDVDQIVVKLSKMNI